jgi:hypothetical protein
VTEGESVVRGQLLASCGSSGRSPVPHIHFQIQQTPHIGSKTIDYPVSHFLEMRGSHYELRSFEVPGEGTVISNIILNRTLVKAFRFIPGQTISYYVTPPSGEGYIVRWEVQIDALNNTCLYCTTTHSKAWFRNDGHLHYFTHFEGDKSSLLFRFFLGTYKIMMGYYPDLEISDLYPVNTFTNPVLLVLQDFLAPFFLFIRAEYRLRYMGLGDEIMQSDLHLRSSTIVNIGKQTTREMEFDLFAGNQGLENFVVRENGQQTEAKLIIHEN